MIDEYNRPRMGKWNTDEVKRKERADRHGEITMLAIEVIGFGAIIAVLVTSPAFMGVFQ